jgi:hypothetical protein
MATNATSDLHADEQTRAAEMAAGERSSGTTQQQHEGSDAQPEFDPVRAELERTKKALAESNRRNAGDRKFREEYERAEEERKANQLSDAERLNKQAQDEARRRQEVESERDQLRRENLGLRIARMVEREAIKTGFQYPEDVEKLIDRETIEVDEDGKILGVKEAVKKLATERPGLLTTPSGGGSPAAMNTRRPGDARTGPVPTTINPIDQARQDLSQHIDFGM